MSEETEIVEKTGTVYILAINGAEQGVFDHHPNIKEVDHFKERYKKSHRALTIRTSINALLLFS